MNAKKTNYDLKPCPCCGALVITTLGEYEICDACDWEDDPIQSTEPDYAGGANKISLNQARKEWNDRLPKL
jgi:hypothetical protein